MQIEILDRGWVPRAQIRASAGRSRSRGRSPTQSAFTRRSGSRAVQVAVTLAVLGVRDVRELHGLDARAAAWQPTRNILRFGFEERYVVPNWLRSAK